MLVKVQSRIHLDQASNNLTSFVPAKAFGAFHEAMESVPPHWQNGIVWRQLIPSVLGKNWLSGQKMRLRCDVWATPTPALLKICTHFDIRSEKEIPCLVLRIASIFEYLISSAGTQLANICSQAKRLSYTSILPASQDKSGFMAIETLHASGAKFPLFKVI